MKKDAILLFRTLDYIFIWWDTFHVTDIDTFMDSLWAYCISSKGYKLFPLCKRLPTIKWDSRICFQSFDFRLLLEVCLSSYWTQQQNSHRFPDIGMGTTSSLSLIVMHRLKNQWLMTYLWKLQLWNLSVLVVQAPWYMMITIIWLGVICISRKILFIYLLTICIRGQLTFFSECHNC